MRNTTTPPSHRVETELLGCLGRDPELRETEPSERVTTADFRYTFQHGSSYIAEQHDTYTEERVSHQPSRPWVRISLGVYDRELGRTVWHRVVSWTVPTGILRLRKGDQVRFLGQHTEVKLRDGSTLRQFEVTNFRLERRRRAPEVD